MDGLNPDRKNQGWQHQSRLQISGHTTKHAKQTERSEKQSNNNLQKWLRQILKSQSAKNTGHQYIRNASNHLHSRNHRLEQEIHDLDQLCPTQMTYWAKNYATILTRAAHWMAYYWGQQNVRILNCNGNRRNKVVLRTTCIKNVKFKIIKTRVSCHLRDTFTTAKT